MIFTRVSEGTVVTLSSLQPAPLSTHSELKLTDSVSDPHCFNADPDANSDPAFYVNADPDPDPGF